MSRRERFDRVLREDVRDLEPVRDIQLLSMFLDLLRHRVGGLVVLSNLAGDLGISPKTAKAWLEILERMYLVFSVRPYTKSLSRAVRKPPKVYFFDNLVATSLLKRLHYLEDSQGYKYELRYIRDKEGREVDFAIVKEGELEELIEVKYSDDSIARSLSYYADRLNPKRAVQIVSEIKRPYDKGKIRVTDPISYFSNFFK